MSASPNNNTLLLAGIGLGAFWFLTRRPGAQPGYARPPIGAGAAQTSGGTVTGELISQGGNLLGQLIKGWSTKGYNVPSILGGYSAGAGLQGYTPDYAPVNFPVSFNASDFNTNTDTLGFGFGL